VLFDQRGAGRGKPHATDPNVDLSTNTAHLLLDIEQLRRHLGIERWLVYGLSWGSTLALAYAEKYPHRATEMILADTATTTTWEIDWITCGIGVFFPEPWTRFVTVFQRQSETGASSTLNRLIGSRAGQVGERHLIFHLEVIADAFPEFQGTVFLPYPARLLRHSAVEIDFVLLQGAEELMSTYICLDLTAFNLRGRDPSERPHLRRNGLSYVTRSSKIVRVASCEPSVDLGALQSRLPTCRKTRAPLKESI
jgi:pimeloyl-ACP methyl ester carboxylesterase